MKSEKSSSIKKKDSFASEQTAATTMRAAENDSNYINFHKIEDDN